MHIRLPMLSIAFAAAHASQASAQVVPLHTVSENVEYRPNPGLVQASDGNIYGTTRGFNLVNGSIFKISCGTNEYSTLYPFTGSDAIVSGLIEGPDRRLYGTVQAGRAANQNGSVFRISSAGRLEPLHVFSDSDGANPSGPLVLDDAGVIYGVTSSGGAADGGVLFRLSPEGVFDVLHDFSLTAAETGTHPRSRLVLADDGRIYGTTTDEGEFGEGALYRMATSGGAPEVVSAFGGAVGQGPHDLLQAPSGRFYGRAFGGQGLIFEIGDAAVVSTLRALSGNDGDFDFNLGDGEASGGALTLGSDGKLYGTAPYGGEEGYGVLFELELDGTFTPLVALTRAVANPKGVLLGNDGNLYFTHGNGVAKFLLPGASSTTLVCPTGAPAEEAPDEPGSDRDPSEAGDNEPDPDEEETDAADAPPSAMSGEPSDSERDGDAEPAETNEDAASALGCALGGAPKGSLMGGALVAIGLAALAARRRHSSRRLGASIVTALVLSLGVTNSAEAAEVGALDEPRAPSAEEEAAAAELEPSAFGVGFQSSWPSFGVSGTIDLNERFALQGVAGFFGRINMFAGRGLYRFSREELWSLYGYGSAGAVTHSFRTEREVTVGLGAGVGLEYDWRAWQRKLPPIRWNLEIGLAYADFDFYDYTGLTFGGGVQYRF